MGLRVGQRAWEDIRIVCHCREFRTDSHQDTELVNTLTELIRLLIIRMEVKENTTGAARHVLQHS
jgi:hypothetical protein